MWVCKRMGEENTPENAPSRRMSERLQKSFFGHFSCDGPGVTAPLPTNVVPLTMRLSLRCGILLLPLPSLKIPDFGSGHPSLVCLSCDPGRHFHECSAARAGKCPTERFLSDFGHMPRSAPISKECF